MIRRQVPEPPCAASPAVAQHLHPAATLDLQAAALREARTPVIAEVLADEVPGIATTSISLAPGVAYREPGSQSEDRVYLVLAGGGEIIAGGAEYLVGRETIAHFPLGWDVGFKAGGPGAMGILVVRQTLTGEDREELLAYHAVSRAAYLKVFDECTPYGEAIKSARTVSRTLLPGGIVPRMAIGSVEAAGPDRVAPHRHPMLEQYFLTRRCLRPGEL